MRRNIAFLVMALLLIFTGFVQGWVVALSIVQLCMISAIMAMGVNIQWGYAGIFNVGVVGFAALGGLATVIVSHPPVPETIAVGGALMAQAALRFALVVIALIVLIRFVPKGRLKNLAIAALLVFGWFFIGAKFSAGKELIEGTNTAVTGFLGGFGIYGLLDFPGGQVLAAMIVWSVGGLLAALAAWGVGKLTLGLRADYLAIATLGIAEIIVAIIKNENWLTRGVNNVTKLPRPVPYEIDLQTEEWFINLAARFGTDVQTASSIFVKLCYIGLFAVVLFAVFWLSQRALASPWGRMVRAIRDNRDAAAAMGKDVKRRHLQIFILGSAVIGIAGAMITTLDGQLVPTTYNPLRYTFLVWVMVIVGGSGNNWGAIFGGFFIWFIYVQAERLGPIVMGGLVFFLPEGDLKAHLLGSAEQIRLLVMGVILILALRFAPKGVLPEESR